MQNADSVRGDFERVGGDLGEDRLDALADGGRSDIDRYRAIPFDRHFRIFARTGTSSLDEAADTQTMIAAIDELALQRAFFLPARLAKTLIEGAGIIAAVACGHAKSVIGFQFRESVMHLIDVD